MNATKKFYVYVYRDPRPDRDNAAIYVGKGSPKYNRIDDHWSRGTQNRLLNGIFKKLRKDGLAPTKKVVAWFAAETEAFAYEIKLIKKFGRRNLGTGTLCNLTDGGDGLSGHAHSPAAKAKMSAAATGRVFTAAHRAKLSAARKRRIITLATAAKIRATLAKPEVKIKLLKRPQSYNHLAWSK